MCVVGKITQNDKALACETETCYSCTTLSLSERVNDIHLLLLQRSASLTGLAIIRNHCIEEIRLEKGSTVSSLSVTAEPTANKLPLCLLVTFLSKLEMSHDIQDHFKTLNNQYGPYNYTNMNVIQE